jgi:3-(3-hydroxy-phenyl)propionate hydroxylase
MAQGMAQGMRDVQNLAWKLETVLDGRGGDSLLDTYESERRAHVLTTTRHTIELGQVISERDSERARSRDRALLALHAGEVPVTMRSNFLPDLADGLLDESSAGAGQIMPQPFILQRDGGVTRLDDAVGPGFVVVCARPLLDDELGALQAAAAPIGGQVVRLRPSTSEARPRVEGELVERDGVVSGWLAELGATIAIARPDHYVYGTADSVDGALSMLDAIRSAVVVDV